MEHPEFDTSYNRMKAVWRICEAQVRQSRSPCAFHFADDGSSVDILDVCSRSHRIPFRLWGSVALNICWQLESAILDLLPDNSAKLYEEFASHPLIDNLGQSWLAEQQGNDFMIDISHIIQERLTSGQKQGLRTTAGKLCSTDATSWIARDANVLGLLACAIYLTCPAAPVQSLLTQLQYAGSINGPRNLYVVDGHLTICFPQGRHMKATIPQGLWPLHPDLSRPLVFYITVIRPVVIHLLEKALLFTKRELSRMESFVFIQLKGRKLNGQYLRTWNRKDFHAALYIHTKESAFHPFVPTCRILRSICIVMFRQLLPDLYYLDEDSDVDHQGQHQIHISNQHYGGNAAIPSIMNLSVGVARQIRLFTVVLHTVIGIGPMEESFMPHFIKSYFFQSNRVLDLAFSEARTLVCLWYKLGGGDTKVLASDLLKSEPFYGTVSPTLTP